MADMPPGILQAASSVDTADSVSIQAVHNTTAQIHIYCYHKFTSDQSHLLPLPVTTIIIVL